MVARASLFAEAGLKAIISSKRQKAIIPKREKDFKKNVLVIPLLHVLINTLL
jgi:hypothetical protein